MMGKEKSNLKTFFNMYENICRGAKTFFSLVNTNFQLI